MTHTRNPPVSLDLLSLTRYAYLGLFVVLGLFGGFTLWAANTEISGAVAAPGAIIVDGFSKRIQHQEGGIVKAFYVKDGDTVSAGQLLAELDDTAIAAGLAVLEKQVREASLREARLIAEINRTSDIDLPQNLRKMIGEPDFDVLLSTERQVLGVRQSALASRSSQLTEQVTQHERQIEGLEMQLKATERQETILDGEIASLKKLYLGNLVEIGRITALEKQQAEAEGRRGYLISTIAETSAAIAERRLQISQVEQDYIVNALSELQDTRGILFDALQQKIAATDKLERTKLRAPQAGVIHQSSLHTVGGVVGAGETLMLVIPQDDNMLISARISPTDIDKLTVGQEVFVRLTGYSQRTTPEIVASVETIAPDLTQDQITGQNYYSARISISEGERATLPADVKLIPGMPVEAFVKTADRTVLAYLLQPFVDQLDYAFREE